MCDGKLIFCAAMDLLELFTRECTTESLWLSKYLRQATNKQSMTF
jgi:hypothetical protein